MLSRTFLRTPALRTGLFYRASVASFASQSDFDAYTAAFKANDKDKIAAITAKYQAPRKIPGVAGGYTNDLFVAAGLKGALPQVKQDLVKITELVEKTPKLGEVFSGGAIMKPEKISQIVDALAQDIGASDITRNLLRSLHSSKKLRLVGKISNNFAQLCREQERIVPVEVTLAKVPTIQEFWTLKQDIKNYMLESTENLELTVKIDQSLLGGFTLAMKGKELDHSLKNKISALSSKIAVEKAKANEEAYWEGAPEWFVEEGKAMRDSRH